MPETIQEIEQAQTSDNSVLIIEDERLVAYDLKKELEHFGYHVSGVATSGRDAIIIAEEKHPNVALVDINIKGNVDGIETARILKTRFEIPVIFVTGYADEETLTRAKTVGPSGYVLKPFRDREVRAAIEMALKCLDELEIEIHPWLGTVLSKLPTPVIAADIAGVIRYGNQAALLSSKKRNLKGARIEEVLGLIVKYANAANLEVKLPDTVNSVNTPNDIYTTMPFQCDEFEGWVYCFKNF